MTALELLEKFVRRKFRDNYKLDEIVGLKDADIQDLRSWDDRDVRDVLELLEPDQCPWCVLTRELRKADCHGWCGYGMRHGVCRDPDSDFWLLSRWRQNLDIHADKDGTTEDLKKILDMRYDFCG